MLDWCAFSQTNNISIFVWALSLSQSMCKMGNIRLFTLQISVYWASLEYLLCVLSWLFERLNQQDCTVLITSFSRSKLEFKAIKAKIRFAYRHFKCESHRICFSRFTKMDTTHSTLPYTFGFLFHHFWFDTQHFRACYSTHLFNTYWENGDRWNWCWFSYAKCT